MKKLTKSRKAINRAFREVHRNMPKSVFETFTSKGPEAAEKQRTAIALNKARQRGAKVPPRKR